VTDALDALARATPLLILGIAILIAFRAGIWNIGAEGQSLAGAVLAAWVGTRWGVASPWEALVLVPALAAAGGAAWALVPAWLRTRFGVLEVITTIMLNFVAVYLVGFLVHGPLQEAGRTYPQSDPVAPAVRLAPLLAGSGVTWALPVGVALAAATWWVLTRTTWGFALRATGANPRAAAISGRIRVERVSTLAFLTSGAIAGLAGAAQVCGVTFALYENLSPGYGYAAIAVALLARLHPLGVIASALLFGALEAGAGALQRSAGVPSVTVYALEGLVIIVMVMVGRRSRAA